MNAATLKDLMQNHDRLNAETLHELSETVERYPYFAAARMLYLRNLYMQNDIRFGKEMKKAALFFSDRSMLFDMAEENRLPARPQPLTQKLQQENRTISLIDAFLSSQPEEDEGKTIDVTTDYVSYLLKEEEQQQKQSSAQIIDEFLQQRKESSAAQQETPAPQEEQQENSYFTETLAKIYIRQRRYDKALEIIKKLSLKFPKKNTYFADQIRFLEKLIINNKTK